MSEIVEKYSWYVCLHSPYCSLALATFDYHVFGTLRKFTCCMMTWQSRQPCIHCSGMLKLMSVSLLAEIQEIIMGFLWKSKSTSPVVEDDI